MGVGRKEPQEGGDICVLIIDSCCSKHNVTQHCKAILLQLKHIFKNVIGKKVSVAIIQTHPLIYG